MKKNTFKDILLISLGGSVLYDSNGFFIDDLIKFINVIQKINKKAIIVVGGGKLAREVISESCKLNFNNVQKDNLGILTTVYNSSIVRELFLQLSNFKIYNKILKKPRKLDFSKYDLFFCAGYKPGVSTDTDTALWAIKNNLLSLINITNVDFIYDKNPKLFNDAKKLKKLSWSDYTKICGNLFKPGLNLPFDPIASKISMNNDLRVFIISKDNLSEICKCVDYDDSKKINGSVIN